MGFLAQRRAKRRRQVAAEQYLTALLLPPDVDDVRWLQSWTGVERQVVERELVFAQRAMGLIVAERDALDDQTAADVAHAIDALVATESPASRDPKAEWVEHWMEYRDALTMRGRAEPPLRRIARVVLRRVGVHEPGSAQLVRAVGMVTRYQNAAHAALTAAFGAAHLPEDRVPSELYRERTGHG
jgi:hypothetical protein